MNDGLLVGLADGALVGGSDGFIVGLVVGWTDGKTLGSGVGGLSVVGIAVGYWVGKINPSFCA
jgi:hypothetical protein